MSVYALGHFGAQPYAEDRLALHNIDLGGVAVTIYRDLATGTVYVLHVKGHDTFESVGHRRYEPARYFVVLIHPEVEHRSGIFDAEVVAATSVGRDWRRTREKVIGAASSFARGLITLDELKKEVALASSSLR